LSRIPAQYRTAARPLPPRAAGPENRLGPALWRSLAALLTLLAGAGSVLAASPSDPLRLTRDEAVVMAIRNNINLKAEALNSAIAARGLDRSRGYYDPILTSTASTGETTFPGEDFRTTSTLGTLGVTQYLPTGGSIALSTQTGYTTAVSNALGYSSEDWQSAVALTVSQPLLKNSGREATELSITLAANTLEDARDRFRFALADTVFAVITSYNRLYSLRQNLAARQVALTAAQDLLTELRQRSRQGQLQRVEIANAEYALTQRRKDLVNAERGFHDQAAHLRYLIGMDEKRQILPVDPPSRREPDETEKEAIALALDSRADLQQLRLALQGAQLQERVAHHQSLPDVAVTVSGGLSGMADSVGESYRQIGDGEGAWWAAGLRFSLPLGNDTARNSYHQSRLRAEQLRARVRAFEWQVRDAVESDLRSLISARLQLQTTDQALQYARERDAEYRKRSRAGTGTVQDLLNAENDLTAAINAQADAVEAFAYAVALLWRDMGVLLEREHIHVDSAHPETAARTVEVDTAPVQGGIAAMPAPPPRPTVSAPPSATAVASASKVAVATLATSAPVAAPSPPVTAGKPAHVAGYTLEIGTFVTTKDLDRAKQVLTRAGLTPVVGPGPKQPTPMIRLFSGRFAAYPAAKARFEALRRAGADPFLLRGPEGGCRVYAGSYAEKEEAQRELRRLAAHGLATTLEAAQVPLPSRLVTAGAFSSRTAAAAAAARLQAQGLPARVLGANE